MRLWFTKKMSRNKSLWPSHWGKLSCHQGRRVVHLGKFNLLMEWLQPLVWVAILPSNLHYNPLPHSIQPSYIFFMCKPTSGDLMFIFTNTHKYPPRVFLDPNSQVILCSRTGENWPTEACRAFLWWPPRQVKYLLHTIPLKSFICLISQYKERHISDHISPLFSSSRAASRCEPGGHSRLWAALEGALRVRDASEPGQDGPERTSVPASGRPGQSGLKLSVLKFMVSATNSELDLYLSVLCSRWEVTQEPFWQV